MHLALFRVEIPFTTTFTHKSASRVATQSVWVVAQTGEVIGVGEGCPREYVTGESLGSAQAFFEEHRESLCRTVQSVANLRTWVNTHTASIDTNPAAWCAMELAILEMFARCEGVPVERVLDLPTTTGAFTYSAIVSDSEAEQFRRTVAQYRAMGFVDFKLKLSDDLNHNHEKIKSMRTEHEQTPLRIRVDANNLWADVDTAVRDLRELAWDFVGIEEPLSPNAFDGMREVSECTGSPIILDESFLRVDQVAALARDAERWIINVRVSKMGGLFRSLAVVQAAGQAGISVIVGAQVGETSVLTRAALVVARAAGTNLVAQEGAFGTHLLQTDVANPVLMFGAGGILKADDYALATASGWGLTLRPTQDFAVSLSE